MSKKTIIKYSLELVIRECHVDVDEEGYQELEYVGNNEECHILEMSEDKDDIEDLYREYKKQLEF